jgi:hypothetical protein
MILANKGFACHLAFAHGLIDSPMELQLERQNAIPNKVAPPASPAIT